MKTFNLLTILLFSINLGIAQEKLATVISSKSKIDLTESLSITNQFLDSTFSNGRVSYTDGKVSTAPMNYNLLDNSIYFYDKSKNLLKLVGLERIKSIRYSNRFFYVENSELYEIVSEIMNYTLLRKLKTKIVKNNEVKGPYGMSLDNSSTETYIGASKTADGEIIYGNDLSNNRSKINIDIKIYRYYYLLINGEYKKINRVKDIAKLFPQKKDELVNFINVNNLSLTNEKDLIKLVEFCVGK